jgi:hypothetical protein
MRITEVMFEPIFGVSVGLNLAPIGHAEDDEGFIIIDLFLFRFIIVYE